MDSDLVLQLNLFSRPTPVPPSVKAGPPKRLSPRRYYVQLSEAGDLSTLNYLRRRISKQGRVVDFGVGTGNRPTSGWVELVVRTRDTASLLSELEVVGLRDRVERLIPVEPLGGRLLARQLDLFRADRACRF